MPMKPDGWRSRWALPAGLALAATTAGCLDLALIEDVVFPSSVPGLPADGTWTSLPVGTWLQESGATARAISACLAPSCGPEAAVGLFTARGAEAERLARALEQPGALARMLRTRHDRPAGASKAVADARAAVAVEPAQAGTLRGFAVGLARPDGSRPVSGLVLARKAAGELTLVVIVTASPDAARRIGGDVARALDG